MTQKLLRQTLIDASFGLPARMGLAENLRRQMQAFAFATDIPFIHRPIERFAEMPDRLFGIKASKHIRPFLRQGPHTAQQSSVQRYTPLRLLCFRRPSFTRPNFDIAADLVHTIPGQIERLTNELLSKVGDAGFRRRVRLAFLRP